MRLVLAGIPQAIAQRRLAALCALTAATTLALAAAGHAPARLPTCAG